MIETLKLKVSPNNCCGTIFSSPHSGCIYLKTLLDKSNLNLAELRSLEDAFVGELFGVAIEHDASFIEAIFPRCFVDLNRSHLELDPKLIEGNFKFESTPRNFAGLGVIPRLSGRGNSIYKKAISFNEAQMRLRNFYFPYHQSISRLILRSKTLLGYAVLFDCHSMPSFFRSFKGSEYKRNNSEIVLGDLNGVSCDPSLTQRVKKIFERHGFLVSINKPFAGGFITKNYGNPRDRVHALQIEINKSLYMDEEKIVPNKHFKAFKKTLAVIIKELSSLATFDDFSKVAAE